MNTKSEDKVTRELELIIATYEPAETDYRSPIARQSIYERFIGPLNNSRAITLSKENLSKGESRTLEFSLPSQTLLQERKGEHKKNLKYDALIVLAEDNDRVFFKYLGPDEKFYVTEMKRLSDISWGFYCNTYANLLYKPITDIGEHKKKARIVVLSQSHMLSDRVNEGVKTLCEDKNYSRSIKGRFGYNNIKVREELLRYVA